MPALSRMAAIMTIGILGAAFAPGQEKSQDLAIVKYDGLVREIQKHRGKVVVVDFWRTDCIPCRKAFPKFIDMQKRYADKGMVLIAVSIDPNDKDSLVRVNKFMEENPGVMRHLLLDEPQDVMVKKFQYEALPFYYLFDRQGKWVRFRASDSPDSKVDYAKLESVLVKMLDEK